MILILPSAGNIARQTSQNISKNARGQKTLTRPNDTLQPYDAWSTPVCIEFNMAIASTLLTHISGAGTLCLEAHDGVSLNQAGYVHDVRQIFRFLDRVWRLIGHCFR